MSVPPADWTSRIQTTQKGNNRQTSFNARLILEHDERWSGVLGWCELSHRVVKRELPPYANASRGEWDDADDADLRYWLGEKYGIEPKGQDLGDAVMGAARCNRFHPVRDYLDGLEWDGTERLSTWLLTYLGAGRGDDGKEQPEMREYLSAVGRMFLISAIARVRRKRAKADHVVILEGDQGLGKSTAIGVLFGEWFTDSPLDLHSKDAMEALRGLWGVELAELDALNKAEDKRAKAFFSRDSDRFRLPYGRNSMEFGRQCVFCGTTNQQVYLKDATGNRRYWPVACTRIDLDNLRADRDQIWAEADRCYQNGDVWWPDKDLRAVFEREQEERFDGDVWESIIKGWLDGLLMEEQVPLAYRRSMHVTMDRVMSDALEMDPAAMRKPEQTRVGMIMSRLGWTRAKRGGNNGYRPGIKILKRIEDEIRKSEERAKDVPF